MARGTEGAQDGPPGARGERSWEHLLLALLPRSSSLRGDRLGGRAPGRGVSPVPAGHLPPVIAQRLGAGQERVLGPQQRRLLRLVVQRVREEGPQLGAGAAAVRLGRGNVARGRPRGRGGGAVGARAAGRALPGPQPAPYPGPEVEVEIGGQQHAQQQQGPQAVPAQPRHGPAAGWWCWGEAPEPRDGALPARRAPSEGGGP